MDVTDVIRTRNTKQITETHQVLVVIHKSRSANSSFIQIELLDHGTHGTIENVDTFPNTSLKFTLHYH